MTIARGWSVDGTILITMAGAGQRFRDAGYTVPKFAIEARGETLFWWSLRSLARFTAAGSRVVFVGRQEDALSPFLARECERLGLRDTTLIELPGPTDGQATTARCALRTIPSDSPLLIYNIDTYVEPEALDPEAVTGDGWIPCFAGPGTHWSFVALDADGRAREVREKQRISPHATIGLYYFASAGLFAHAYEHFYAGGHREAGERYIAPLYNQLIAEGRDVRIVEVPASAVHVLGTPAEVEAFVRG
jgi:NDP-sugar pyrophosphorylase family protein